jgi:membrane fusion protein (multidrug efflux system)
MKSRVLVIVVALVIAGGGAAWYLARQGGSGDGAAPSAATAGPSRRPPLVVVEPARLQQLNDTVEAIGTTQANESVTLTAKVTDTVRRVNFEDGDYVEAGTVLLELTNQEEQALLDEARANLDDAQNQLRRVEDLAEKGLTAASALDTARSNAAASRARLNTVVARLKDRLIQAPFSGLLGFRNVSPGTLVTPTTPITTLDDVSVIKLDFTVPETFLGSISPGAKVYAHTPSWPDREFNGQVRTVGSRVDPVTRAVVVRAHLPNDDRALRPGMLMTVRVVMAQREALVVPEGAVFEIRDQAYVFLVSSDRIAKQHPIDIGERRFGLVEVTGGLREGDMVVTEGMVKLRDGTKVRFPDSEEPELSGVEAPGEAGSSSDAHS